MLSCIAGAIMLACSKSAAITIDGPMRMAESYQPQAGAWAYAVYNQPLLQTRTFFLPRRS